MIIECKECGGKVSDKAFSCPHCGFPMAKITTKRVRKWRKMPNGYGSIHKLTGRRRKPYAVYAPVKQYDDNGKPIQPPTLGYFETYQDALACLIDYNRGKINIETRNYSFKDVYDLYFEDKFVKNKKREYSRASMDSSKASFFNFKSIHDCKFKDLRTVDYQQIIDGTNLKHASIELMVMLIKQMYKYAVANDIVEKDYGQYVKVNIPDDDEKGVPFTEEEINVLWENSTDKTIQTTLLLIYTGFRVNELKTAKIDLIEHIYVGGSKTKAGKERIVPIHDLIYDFAVTFDANEFNVYNYRSSLTRTLKKLNIDVSAQGTKRTPHDCRHTFSWLCDKYGVDKLAKHLIMGHSLGNDIEENTYGHRTILELKQELKKIQKN